MRTTKKGQSSSAVDKVGSSSSAGNKSGGATEATAVAGRAKAPGVSPKSRGGKVAKAKDALKTMKKDVVAPTTRRTPTPVSKKTNPAVAVAAVLTSSSSVVVVSAKNVKRGGTVKKAINRKDMKCCESQGAETDKFSCAAAAPTTAATKSSEKSVVGEKESSSPPPSQQMQQKSSSASQQKQSQQQQQPHPSKGSVAASRGGSEKTAVSSSSSVSLTSDSSAGVSRSQTCVTSAASGKSSKSGEAAAENNNKSEKSSRAIGEKAPPAASSSSKGPSTTSSSLAKKNKKRTPPVKSGTENQSESVVSVAGRKKSATAKQTTTTTKKMPAEAKQAKQTLSHSPSASSLLVVSKELKNLGINLKDYHENVKKADEVLVIMASANDKTSICESVKTKSRNQSIYSAGQFPLPGVPPSNIVGENSSSGSGSRDHSRNSTSSGTGTSVATKSTAAKKGKVNQQEQNSQKDAKSSGGVDNVQQQQNKSESIMTPPRIEDKPKSIKATTKGVPVSTSAAAVGFSKVGESNNSGGGGNGNNNKRGESIIVSTTNSSTSSSVQATNTAAPVISSPKTKMGDKKSPKSAKVSTVEAVVAKNKKKSNNKKAPTKEEKKGGGTEASVESSTKAGKAIKSKKPVKAITVKGSAEKKQQTEPPSSKGSSAGAGGKETPSVGGSSAEKGKISVKPIESLQKQESSSVSALTKVKVEKEIRSVVKQEPKEATASQKGDKTTRIDKSLSDLAIKSAESTVVEESNVETTNVGVVASAVPVVATPTKDGGVAKRKADEGSATVAPAGVVTARNKMAQKFSKSPIRPTSPSSRPEQSMEAPQSMNNIESKPGDAAGANKKKILFKRKFQNNLESSEKEKPKKAAAAAVSQKSTTGTATAVPEKTVYDFDSGNDMSPKREEKEANTTMSGVVGKYEPPSAKVKKLVAKSNRNGETKSSTEGSAGKKGATPAPAASVAVASQGGSDNKKVLKSLEGDAKTANKKETKVKPATTVKSVLSAAGQKTGGSVKERARNRKRESSEDEEDEEEERDSSSESSDVSSTRSSERNKISKKNIISDSLALGGQKPHRVASLNAQAKVQCLYENESRSAHELGLLKLQASRERFNATVDEASNEENDSGGGAALGGVGERAAKRKGDGVAGASTQRSLRNAPGLRAVGKHWEMNDISSSEDEDDSPSDSGSSYVVEGGVSDKLTAPGTGSSSITTTGANATSTTAERTKKKPLPKKRTKLQQQQLTKDVTNASPVITASSATSPGKLLGKKKAPPTNSGSPRKVKQKRIEAQTGTVEKAAGDESQSELLTEVGKKKSSEASGTEAAVKDTGLSRKRMASLNASAFMAANYETEQTLDRNLSATESSSEDMDDDDKSQNTDTDAKSQQSSFPSSTGGSKAKSSTTASSVRSSATGKRAPKKVKKEAVDEAKNSSGLATTEPTTSVMILQDTDVTITGVYVNSSVGTSQESYCKMQYRVQSSVTEERVLRHNSQSEPPKCYTPLNALSSMRPPVQQQQQQQQQAHEQLLSEETAAVHQPEMMPPHNMAEYHRDPGLGMGLKDYQYPEYSPYGPHPSMYHHGMGSHVPPQHMMGPGPSTSAFCAPPPTGTTIQGQHELGGYYQPAGPLISGGHPGGQQPQSPLKTKPDPLVGAGQTVAPPSLGLSAQQQPGPGQPHPVHQPTPSVGLVEHHRLEAGDPGAATNDLHRSQAFRYIPQPTGPYARPAIHQIHCTYPPPPPPPTYYAYGQHPQEICYPPPYQPYYPQKMYATAPPPPSAYRRYVSGSYYQGGDIYDHQGSSRLLPPPPQNSSGPPPPPPLDQYPYYSPYASASAAQQYYGRQVQSYLDSAPPPGSGGGAGGTGLPPPIPYPNSCPCPMQSCSKNVHTGPLIGSSSSKGPGQQQSQQQQGSNNSCKTEDTNEYPKHKSSHFEQSTVPPQPLQSHSFCATAPSYTVNTALEPEMSTSPARGSTGLSMPTTPVSPSNSEISGSNGSGSGSMRKARIGKNSVREQQLMMSNGPVTQSGPTTMENLYAQEMQPHIQHYHHDMMYNPNLYQHGGHYDQRYGNGQPTYVGHIHHVPQPPVQPPPLNKEDDLFVNTTSVKQEPIIKTERLEVKQEQVSGDEDTPVVKLMAKEVLEKRKDRSRERVEGGPCDSASVTKPNKNFAVEEKQSEDQCQRASDKTNEEEDGVCDISRSSRSKEGRAEEEEVDDTPTSSSSRSAGQSSSLLRLSGSGEKSPNGPKKSNYKKLIKPAEPKPYLSCAASGSLKRSDKMRNRYPNCSERARMRMLKRRRRRHQQFATGTGKVKRRVQSKTKLGKVMHCRSAAMSSVRGKQVKRPKTNDSTTSAESSSFPSSECAAQDRNNNNSDKELNNNVPVGVLDEDGKRSNLDATIDLVARGYFEDFDQDDVEKEEDEDDDVPLVKRPKLSEEPAVKVKPSLSTKNGKTSATAVTKGKAAEKRESEIPEPQKPQPKAKAKKSKATKKDKVVPIEEPDEEKNAVPTDDEGIVANTSLPDPGGNCCTGKEKEVSISEMKATEEDQYSAKDVPEAIQFMETVSSTSLIEESIDEVRLVKGRPGRRPKKGGLKLSSRKRKAQRRLSKAMEEVPIKKHVGAPRWSNGWNWLGESFQGLVFLNSDDTPVMRTCYPAMRHSEGDIIRPRDCVLLRAGSKRNELPYVAKVAHLWENPEDGEMMMSLLWYYRPEHTEQGRQEADGGEEVFASKHKDHNSVACIEDKCYVLTFNEYCRYRRILKSVEENVDVSPSIVPALKPDQLGMLAPKVPLNTSPELVMFCYRVYEFRFKRMKNFY